MQGARPALQLGAAINAGRGAADRCFVDMLDEGRIAGGARPKNQAVRQLAAN
jgi:hypothetical protein